MRMMTMFSLAIALVLFLFLFLFISLRRLKKSLLLVQQPSQISPMLPGTDVVGMDVAPPYKLTQSRHGWMLVNPKDAYLGQAILQYGECCEIEVAFLLQLISIRPGIVLEVGTNIGTHTVPLAKALALERRQMFVFEPQPFIFQNMCANLALNGLSNVNAQPLACGNQQGTVYFPLPDYVSDGNFGGVSMNADRIDGGVTVQCARLDDVVSVDAVSMMKIDVEGFELRVLQGAEGIIDRSRPVLFLENDRVENSKELIEWIESKNYRLWWHITPLFNPNNFLKNGTNIYGNICSFNMLGLPREFELDFPVGSLQEVVGHIHPLDRTSH